MITEPKSKRTKLGLKKNYNGCTTACKNVGHRFTLHFSIDKGKYVELTISSTDYVLLDTVIKKKNHETAVIKV